MSDGWCGHNGGMKIAVVTLDGFNEIDSFVASYILGRVQRQDWEVAIASPMTVHRIAKL